MHNACNTTVYAKWYFISLGSENFALSFCAYLVSFCKSGHIYHIAESEKGINNSTESTSMSHM